MLTEPQRLSDELDGLDALELAAGPTRSRRARVWSVTWPKLAAVALALAIWELVYLSGWKPKFVLPPPADVLARFRDEVADGTFRDAFTTTIRRAAAGFTLATVIGVVVGGLVARVRVLRVAFGSLITGLQTMPSVAWFPAAFLLFGLSEEAILFVVVLGAAPSIANGLIAGTDQVPPILLRAGHVLGARGLTAYRHVVLPASLPSFVAGLKQGWAFSWRSLMAGELLLQIAGTTSIGYQLSVYRDLLDAEGLYATMLLILLIGIFVDAVLFATAERAIRRRWGLEDPAVGR